MKKDIDIGDLLLWGEKDIIWKDGGGTWFRDFDGI